MDKQRQFSSEEVRCWLSTLRKDLSGPSLKSQLLPILSRIVSAATSNHLGCLVAVHNTSMFDTLLSLCVEQVSDKDPSLSNKMEVLYHIGFDSFLGSIQPYRSIFQNLRDKFKLGQFQAQKYLSGDQQRYRQMRELMAELFSVKNRECQVESREMMGSIEGLIERVLEFIPRDGFEEIFITWIRKQLQELRFNVYQRLNINNTSLCCRLHFMHNQTVPGIDTATQIFVHAKEKSKISSTKYYPDYFKKLAVGFLNSNGGVIYLGADCDVKKCNVTGITMPPEQRKTVLNLFWKEIFGTIYPSCELKKGKQQDKEALENEKRDYLSSHLTQVNFQYRINRFISMDFLNLYDSENLLYSRVDGQVLYFVRVKIRPGDSYQLYHFINDKQIPETFLREGRKQKQLTFKQFYEEFYRKAKLKLNRKDEPPNQTPGFHQFCRLFKVGSPELAN